MRYSESDFPAICRMNAVTLKQMKTVSLMNRVDTKFVTDVPTLQLILEDALKAGFQVCEIGGKRLLSYDSVYYDTKDVEMFRVHRNGKKNRFKVRIRKYLIDNEAYIEIKRKNNHGRTKKKRIRFPSDKMMELGTVQEASEFLQEITPWKADVLSPEAGTSFTRFTLTDQVFSERLTIDTNLEFCNFRSGQSVNMGSLVIIELKQDGRKESLMRPILRKHRVFPYRVSKYCVAVTLTDPSARPGRYLDKIRYIEKKTGQKLYNR